MLQPGLQARVSRQHKPSSPCQGDTLNLPSRGAATEGSPWREPWVQAFGRPSPVRGDRTSDIRPIRSIRPLSHKTLNHLRRGKSTTYVETAGLKWVKAGEPSTQTGRRRFERPVGTLSTASVTYPLPPSIHNLPTVNPTFAWLTRCGPRIDDHNSGEKNIFLKISALIRI